MSQSRIMMTGNMLVSRVLSRHHAQQPIIQNARKTQDGGVPVDTATDMLRQIKAQAVGFNDACECETQEDSYQSSKNVAQNCDAKLYRASEDPSSPLFESLPALILDLNGVLLTTVNCRYAQPPPYWKMLEVTDMGGSKLLGQKPDADRFMQWCFERFDVFIWTCANKVNANRILRCFMPFHMQRYKGVLTQEHCTEENKFQRITNKPVFYKKLIVFWDTYPQYTPTNTIMVDDSEYKTLWNPQGSACIVKKMEDQTPGEMQSYLTTVLKDWLDTWLGVEDRLVYTVSTPLPISKDEDSIAVQKWWMQEHVKELVQARLVISSFCS